jgi:prevent-host-death family protein
MTQMEVGIRELKAQLSGYMKRVKAGETVIITERGRAVGRIVPMEQSVEARLQAMLQERSCRMEWTNAGAIHTCRENIWPAYGV